MQLVGDRRPFGARREWPTPAAPEHLLYIGGSARAAGRLLAPALADGAEVALDAIAAAARAAGPSGARLLAGGEPTLRRDLPDLIRAVSSVEGPPLGMRTDGAALGGAGVLASLARAGLGWIRVPLHCARSDAHDWLVGAPGAARQAARAIRAAVAEGVGVEVEATLTRPTAPYLDELVALAARLGARSLRFARLPEGGAPPDAFVALSPRFGLLEAYLDAAVAAAEGAGVTVSLVGLPRCAAQRHDERRVAASAIRFVLPPSLEAAGPSLARVLVGGEVAGPCAACPGAPRCDGAPADYVERFGWCELDSERAAPAPVTAPSLPLAPATPPPPRAGRSPATRLRAVARQAARDSLHGDPLAGIVAHPTPPSLRVAFVGPSRVACPDCGDAGPVEPEPTRALRMRLVRAAQEGAPSLRIASAASLAHPHAAELLREATRLSLPRVEVAGEGSALAELTDGQIIVLRHLARVDVALYGPDAARHDAHMERPGALAAATTGLARLAALAEVETGAFAVLHDARPVADYAAAWDAGALPGRPAFRLAERGATLDALADAAGALPDAAPARAALAAVLPPCLLSRADDVAPAAASTPAFGHPAAPSSGSDRLGRFAPCPHAGACAAAQRCPGVAVGWSSARLAPVAAEVRP